MNENGPLLISELLFLSIDFRRLGRSLDVGSNDRLRRLNCCILPRFLGAESSWSTTVGAVVMIEGAVVRHVSADAMAGLWETNYPRARQEPAALLQQRVPLPLPKAESLMHGESASD